MQLFNHHEDGTVSVKSLDDIPVEARRCITKLKVTTRVTQDGDTETTIDIELMSQDAALTNAMKHLGLMAPDGSSINLNVGGLAVTWEELRTPPALATQTQTIGHRMWHEFGQRNQCAASPTLDSIPLNARRPHYAVTSHCNRWNNSHSSRTSGCSTFPFVAECSIDLRGLSSRDLRHIETLIDHALESSRVSSAAGPAKRSGDLPFSQESSHPCATSRSDAGTIVDKNREQTSTALRIVGRSLERNHHGAGVHEIGGGVGTGSFVRAFGWLHIRRQLSQWQLWNFELLRTDLFIAYLFRTGLLVARWLRKPLRTCHARLRLAISTVSSRMLRCDRPFNSLCELPPATPLETGDPRMSWLAARTE